MDGLKIGEKYMLSWMERDSKDSHVSTGQTYFGDFLGLIGDRAYFDLDYNKGYVIATPASKLAYRVGHDESPDFLPRGSGTFSRVEMKDLSPEDDKNIANLLAGDINNLINKIADRTLQNA